MKNSQSFIGRINDLNMVLVFENGDLELKMDQRNCLMIVLLNLTYYMEIIRTTHF